MSVSGSLSHIMKIWENVKLAMQRCKVAFPREDTDDPSAVCRCSAAVGSNDRDAPESIRTLNLFPACSVTVGQSYMSPMV